MTPREPGVNLACHCGVDFDYLPELYFSISLQSSCFSSSLHIVLSLHSFFFFLGPYLWHKKSPGPGVKLKLQLLAYTTAIAMPDP